MLVTNITGMSRRDITHATIRRTAIDLFARQGYASTTTSQVAAAAGVSEMTVFRHFPTKERLLLEDLYDPLMADAVRSHLDEPPLSAIASGVRDAWQEMGPDDVVALRTVIGIVNGTSALAGALERNSEATMEALTVPLVERGTSQHLASAAAAAVVAALGAALRQWAASGDADPGPWIESTLDMFTGAQTC